MTEDLSHAEAAPDGARRAMAGLFGRDALYMAVLAGQVVLAAMVTPFITRLMARDQYGLVASATAVTQVLFALGGLGLATAIQRRYAQGRHLEARKLVSVAIGSASLVTVVAHVTGPLWSGALGFDNYGPLLWLTVTWAGASAVTGCCLALIRSQDRLLRFMIVGVLQSVVAELIALTVVIVHESPASLLYVAGKTAAQMAALTIGLICALPARPRWSDRPMLARNLRFSIPLVPTALSTFVLAAGDRLILQRLLGPDAVGAYQVAYNVGSVPILLLGLLSISWLPRLFGLATERATVLARSRDAIYRLLPPVMLGMALAGPIVLRVWAPPSYSPDSLALTLSIVVISIVPEAGGQAATRTLLTFGRTNAVAVCTAGAAVANILLNFALIPVFGLVGSAFATFLSLAVLMVALSAAARRIADLTRVPKLTWLGLGASAAGAVASALVPVGGTFLPVRFVLGSLAFVWLLAIIRRIRVESAAPREPSPDRSSEPRPGTASQA